MTYIYNKTLIKNTFKYFIHVFFIYTSNLVMFLSILACLLVFFNKKLRSMYLRYLKYRCTTLKL